MLVMDEVAFHVSQQLEHIQVLLYNAIQSGQNLVELYAEKCSQLILTLCNSEKRLLIKDICIQKINVTIEFGKQISKTTLKYTNPTFFYVKFTQLVGPECRDQRMVMAGCVGLVVGTGIGISVGLCLQSPQRPLAPMRAVTVTGFTGVDAVALMEDITTPMICSPDDVLIQVKSGSVDPMDIKICSGYARVLRNQLSKYNLNVRGELPLVLGRDLAGIVRDIGSAVTRLDVGDEVWLWYAVAPWLPGTLSETNNT